MDPDSATLDHVGMFSVSDLSEPDGDDYTPVVDHYESMLEMLHALHRNGHRASVSHIDPESHEVEISFSTAVRDLIEVLSPRWHADSLHVALGETLADATGSPFDQAERIAWQFAAHRLLKDFAAERRVRKRRSPKS